VTVKYRTETKALFFYSNLCTSVILDSLLCSFTSIPFLTNMQLSTATIDTPCAYHRVHEWWRIKIQKRSWSLLKWCWPVSLVEQKLL